MYAKTHLCDIFNCRNKNKMAQVKITIMKKVIHQDLIDKYENPIEHACDMQVGQAFITDGYRKPEGLCESSWQSMREFAFALASGGGNFYDGWMKNKHSAIISCNDGFRPVSFLLETVE